MPERHRVQAHACRNQGSGFPRSIAMTQRTGLVPSSTTMAAIAVLAFTVGWTPLAEADITRIVITRVESPTFEGVSFGAVGQYEKLVGRAFGEVDPHDPRNAVIVDIALAPRNARGMVEYSTDIYILRPVDPDQRQSQAVLRGQQPRQCLLLRPDERRRNAEATIRRRLPTPATDFSCARDTPLCRAGGTSPLRQAAAVKRSRFRSRRIRMAPPSSVPLWRNSHSTTPPR